MKIAILGTRGIPNQYGGFEQLAEMLSAGLVAKGEDVTVYSPRNPNFDVIGYSPHHHKFNDSNWNGVHIIYKYCPSKLYGSFGQFIYDLKCILDSRRRKFDIICQLGYTSSSVWYWLHPRKAIVITNMDGIEWQRDKYGRFVKKFLKYAEKLAVKRSHILIADSIQIKNYLHEQYGVDAHYISYGADIFEQPDASVIRELDLEPEKYYLNIARFQSDNNQGKIIKGFLLSKSQYPLVLIGDYTNHYGRYLRKKYPGKKIVFLGAVFDKKILDNLRFYSKVYFHGHSGGGTNPSLLEAMGAQALICAHDNPFNREALGENAFYFKSKYDISELLAANPEKESYLNRIENNRLIIEDRYSWEAVIESYYELFNSSAHRKKSLK
jgi:glycosyltransferase involved in cell wall biosynthesis